METTIIERKRKSIELATNLYNSMLELSNHWTESGVEVSDTLAESGYPFDKSLDDLTNEVGSWIDTMKGYIPPKNGKFEYINDDGGKFVGHYVNGKLHGTVIEYYPNTEQIDTYVEFYEGVESSPKVYFSEIGTIVSIDNTGSSTNDHSGPNCTIVSPTSIVPVEINMYVFSLLTSTVCSKENLWVRSLLKYIVTSFCEGIMPRTWVSTTAGFDIEVADHVAGSCCISDVSSSQFAPTMVSPIWISFIGVNTISPLTFFMIIVSWSIQENRGGAKNPGGAKKTGGAKNAGGANDTGAQAACAASACAADCVER